MVERNAFPMYGNVISISLNGYKKEEKFYAEPDWKTSPKYFESILPGSSLLEAKYKADAGLNRIDSNKAQALTKSFIIERSRTSNNFVLRSSNSVFKNQTIPFYTDGIKTATSVLKTDFQLNVQEGYLSDNSLYPGTPANLRWHKIKSQPSDSLFKPMMHRSDNFFAEQTLLMVSNEYLGYMSGEKIIDTLLKYDLKDVPQKPKWVDGSGLSRYNLFTPQSFVYILNKTKNEFGLARLKKILPTGGTGTLSAYFKKDSGFIYAKTGTLSNNCSLSGFLITQKGKLLIFSVLTNNYMAGATPVRKAVEKFLLDIRKKY
jgi:D-alanyl-D-alanine carboxypeptidase/D-alanyl-D-alanine-endopeptidase (penicillin-binding protein 4)